MSTKLPLPAVPSGLTASARHALRDGFSMLKEFVFLSATSVPPGTKLPELVQLATMDQSFRKVTVLPTSTPVLSPKATSSAKLGIRKIVSSAQIELSSMLMVSVCHLALSATLSTRPLEIALPALLDMTWSKVNVSTRLPTLPILVTLDVEPGIGQMLSASPAQKDGLSTLKIYVFLLLINARLMRPDSVPHAIRDMISLTDNVFSLFQTMLSLLISVVELGTGKTKSV